MALIPVWKVKRELTRLVKQIVAVPGNIYTRFLSTLVHDLIKQRHIKRFNGDLPRGDRVAIYLIFPSDGLLPSHKLAIEHLKANGYAPLVVSNLPLTESDRDWLTRHTYKFLSRPNIGYDFGGYREGFLTISNELQNLEYLAFFNDSVWFPTPGSKAWIPQAEALNVAYASAASSLGIPRIPFNKFRKIEWRIDVKLKHFHYCSYALLVRKEILRSRAFWRYWKFIPLTGKKNQVVRFGEIGMTKFVLRNNFTHGATYDLMTLPSTLEGCSEKEINRIAQNLITLGGKEVSQFLEDVLPTLDAQRSETERDDLVKLILQVSGRIGVTYVLPELLHTHHGLCFLKKSPLTLCKRDSDIMMEFGKSLSGPEGTVIEEEMQKMRASKGMIN